MWPQKYLQYLKLFGPHFAISNSNHCQVSPDQIEQGFPALAVTDLASSGCFSSPSFGTLQRTMSVKQENIGSRTENIWCKIQECPSSRQSTGVCWTWLYAMVNDSVFSHSHRISSACAAPSQVNVINKIINIKSKTSFVKYVLVFELFQSF